MSPEVTRDDVEREIAFLRANVDDHPALALLIDKYDPDTLQLSIATGREQLAASSRPTWDQSAALQTRRELFEVSAGVLNRLFLDEEISLDDWLDGMRQNVKDLHIAAYIAGMQGEWGDMTPSDWGRVGRTIRTQYSFLDRWATQIATSLDPSLAQMDARAALYGAAASQSFEAGRALQAGFNPSLLPAQPGDGTTACKANCKCFWLIVTISKRRGDYNVSWKMSQAEHCDTCPKRQKAWRSLKIRGGRMISEVASIYAGS